MNICRVLTMRGYGIDKFYAANDQLIFTLIILPDESAPWRKAFQISEREADPNTVEAMIKAWKEKVRWDIQMGRPSKVVRESIRHFGTLAVSVALMA